MATYLDLVNEALRESGSTLDQLTSGTFPSPSDPLYTKFQNWVVQAWADIQTERRDWQYMQGTGVTICTPKMEVYGAFSSGGLVTDFSSVSMSLHHTANTPVVTTVTLSGTDATDTLVTAGKAEGDLTMSFPGTVDFVIEPGDLLTDATGAVTCYFQRWGRYTPTQVATIRRNTTTDIAEIKLDSVAISDVQYASGQSYDSTSYTKLEYVPYSKWLAYGYDRPKKIGTPSKFTVSNDGALEFFPPLDTTYHLYFEYTKTPQTLSAYGDTPTGLPARFHKAISWRALMYYGEYDGISRIYNIAKNRYSKFEYEMVRDLLPEVSIGYDARRF